MKTLLVDTNLLILLVVGQASVDYIGKHKCLKEFTVSDYQLLIGLISQASSIRFTPNTLTETSNLLKHIKDPARSDISRKFAEIINAFDESYVGSRMGVRQEEFVRLGLTDSILLCLASDPSIVLITTDLGLYLAAMNKRLNVLNFNHHRDLHS